MFGYPSKEIDKRKWNTSWEEIERLAEYIKENGVDVVEVLSIEPLGSPGCGLCMNEYFVKCAYKHNGLPFVVKSYEHWESRKTPPVWL